MDNNQNGFDFGGDQSPLYAQANRFTDEITPKRGFSIASLVLGIFGILCCCFWPIGGTCAVLALIFMIISRKQNGHFDGMAIAGLVLSILGLVLFVYIIVCEILALIYPEMAGDSMTYEEYLKWLEEMGLLQPEAVLNLFR